MGAGMVVMLMSTVQCDNKTYDFHFGLGMEETVAHSVSLLVKKANIAVLIYFSTKAAFFLIITHTYFDNSARKPGRICKILSY
jgi:hypothetical protein